MKLEEIKKKFKNEWVLVEYDQLDENLNITGGNVLAHSSDKSRIYDALRKISGKKVSIEYTGPVDKNLTVMFLFL